MGFAKRATHRVAASNQTSHFGIMAGRPSVVGLDSSARFQMRTRGSGTPIPTDPVAGLNFMRQRGLLSVNPQSSGGVGRTRGRTVMFNW